MEKILSICTPLFNQWAYTKSYLKDLSRLPNNNEIILVDNGSTDETQRQLETSKEVIYFRSEVNKGFGWGSNKAMSLSSAPNILFLNNDIKVREKHENWTDELLKYCGDHIVGPTMGQLDKDFNFVQEANRELTGLSYMSGWCFCASKKLLLKLNIPRKEKDEMYQVFDDNSFFCYYEDSDLSFRARKQHIPFKIVSIPVIHFGKRSSRQLNVGELYNKSRLIFINKWKNKV
jgi:GT2 family glycosyltransferase